MKMKIYVHPTSEMGRFGRGYVAITEKHEYLDSHFCSDDEWAKKDLGVDGHAYGFGIERRKKWEEKFPEGIEVSFCNTIIKEQNEAN